jgi:hypothetical protein
MDEHVELTDDEPADEGTRAAREQAQQTGEHAKQLRAPHDEDAGRGDPSPSG